MRKKKVLLKSNTRNKQSFSCRSRWFSFQIINLMFSWKFSGMILSRIDHLKPSEQLIVKCAAVLGMSFTRDMLKAIIPSSLKTDIAKFRNAIHLLTQVGIFECDSPSTGTEIKRFSAGIRYVVVNFCMQSHDQWRT